MILQPQVHDPGICLASGEEAHWVCVEEGQGEGV